MDNTRKKAIFIVEMEWNEDHQSPMTAQVGRDKLLTPVQELWIMHFINKFSIEEVTKTEKVSTLIRGNKKGKRHSFYTEPEKQNK